MLRIDYVISFGHYEFEEDAVCVIEKCKKEEIRGELERISGITEMRLFPDFEGFASLQDDRTPYTPINADEYTKRAGRAVQKREFEEAIADYDKAIYRKSHDSSLYYLRGFAKAQLEEYEKAILDYNEAIQLNPNETDVYYQRGFAKAQLEQYEEAILDYNEAIQLNPDEALVYQQRSLAKVRLGQYQEAEEDHQKSEQLTNQD